MIFQGESQEILKKQILREGIEISQLDISNIKLLTKLSNILSFDVHVMKHVRISYCRIEVNVSCAGYMQ